MFPHLHSTDRARAANHGRFTIHYVRIELPVHFVPNWTSAAGALEGVLAMLGTPLPRHAIMGLSGHAWHFRLGVQEGVAALPSGPVDLDWELMTANYSRLGWRWERFGARPGPGAALDLAREAALAWAIPHLDAGRPLIGFDFHLREFGAIAGYDSDAACWLVDDLLSPQYGLVVPWQDWPGPGGWVELFAPVEPMEVDAIDAVAGALKTARDFLRGVGGGDSLGGAPGLERWAEALEGDATIDRAGNAYTIAVLLAARSDGAAFLRDLAESLPELGQPLTDAARAISEEVKTLSPLATLFPFPAGGHGSIDVPGLRRAAATALRRAAAYEQSALEPIEEAIDDLAGA